MNTIGWALTIWCMPLTAVPSTCVCNSVHGRSSIMTKGAFKMHTLIDIKNNIPNFIMLTPVNVHDTLAKLTGRLASSLTRQSVLQVSLQPRSTLICCAWSFMRTLQAAPAHQDVLWNVPKCSLHTDMDCHL